jgi:hypothetical protein
LSWITFRKTPARAGKEKNVRKKRTVPGRSNRDQEEIIEKRKSKIPEMEGSW